MTHTYAELEISRAAYDEIAQKLRAAGYDHAFIDETIDMHGIGLTPAAAEIVDVSAFLNSIDSLGGHGVPVKTNIPSLRGFTMAPFEASAFEPLPPGHIFSKSGN